MRSTTPLSLAFEATEYSLAHFEKMEFDSQENLFRGPGWSDGVAGLNPAVHHRMDAWLKPVVV